MRVLSYFVLPGAEGHPSNNLSFRLCIVASDKSKLLAADHWSLGIAIRNWVFKPKKMINLRNLAKMLGNQDPPRPPALQIDQQLLFLKISAIQTT